MKLGSMFKNGSWKWPTGFRVMSFPSRDILKNVKYSIFSDTAKLMVMFDSSWSQSTSYLPTTTTTTDDDEGDDDKEEEEMEDSDSVETKALEEALRSRRMSFDPGNSSRSMLLLDDDDNDDSDNGFCYQECATMEMMTKDPYGDFRVSMEEMVEAYGSKTCTRKSSGSGSDWKYLEELLSCYLKINDVRNHGFIVGAFIDVFVGLAS